MMNSTDDLLAEMKRVKEAVDKMIMDRLLPASDSVKEVDLLYRMMRDYPSRTAKGMRPFLCVTTAKAAGGSESDSMLTAACLELFQNWILIHDDIEDQSDLRRGAPSLHKKYGQALALNAGDALHARMWGSLLDNERIFGPEKTLEIMKEFSNMVNETTEGQHMELGWEEGRRWDLTEADYISMCVKKTSWYTVASPCRLGAIAGGGSPQMRESLLVFGSKLGVAFQIQDDVLNLIGEQSKYGKAKSDDILEGKRTLILLRAMEEATGAEKKRLLSVMAKERALKTEDDVAFVMGLVEQHSAIGYAQKKAAELLRESLAVLKSISWKGDPASVSMLKSFAVFAVEREW